MLFNSQVHQRDSFYTNYSKEGISNEPMVHRALNCKNKIRKQTQVYMANPMEGW